MKPNEFEIGMSVFSDDEVSGYQEYIVKETNIQHYHNGVMVDYVEVVNAEGHWTCHHQISNLFKTQEEAKNSRKLKTEMIRTEYTNMIFENTNGDKIKVMENLILFQLEYDTTGGEYCDWDARAVVQVIMNQFGIGLEFLK